MECPQPLTENPKFWCLHSISDWLLWENFGRQEHTKADPAGMQVSLLLDSINQNVLFILLHILLFLFQPNTQKIGKQNIREINRLFSTDQAAKAGAELTAPRIKQVCERPHSSLVKDTFQTHR